MISQFEIEKFELAWEKIKLAQKLLVSHLSPDVDAISSLGALIEILKGENKEYLAFAEGKNGDYYFLPNEEEVIEKKDDLVNIINKKFNQGFDQGLNQAKEVGDNFLFLFDLIIVVDCGSIDRTFLAEEILNFKEKSFKAGSGSIIEFDHHVPSKSYADIEIKIPLASTTEVLYHFVNINEININKSLANCLLAGILTDTANFLYPSVSSKTMEIASELMALGAQLPKLINNTWRNKSFLEMKLWGLALDNLKINKKYNIAFSVLTYEELENFKNNSLGLSSDVFGDMVGFLSNISEADVVLLLREEERGKIKGSLRVGSTDKDIDVCKLAVVFGGGGHKKASGFVVDGSIFDYRGEFRIL